jgi:arylsulfatase A-like enzyme
MIFRLAAALCLSYAAFAQTPVILISIDTLRADHLSLYGYRRNQTPNLDSFAAHGTVFTAADCQAPLTLPSHVSLFTSTYPFANGIQENAEPLPAGAVTLATVLKARGYKTGAFIGSVFLEQRMGLNQGFDFYDSPFDFRVFSPMSGEMFFAGTSANPMGVRDRRDGALVVRAATQWLAANNGAQPVFAFLHFFDVHLPYKSGYDAQVSYVDQLLGTFRQALVRAGWWDRSLVILLADHGESLGDHGEASHGYFIYQSTLHVPLLIHWPQGRPAGLPDRVEQPVGLIDVAPTILDYLHIPAPPSFAGRSLLDRTPRPVAAESTHAYDAFGWSPLRSIRIGGFKYIEAPKPELYDLNADPGEQTNLVARDAKRAESMRAALAQVVAANQPKRAAPAANLSPQERALLSSNGYLAPGPKSAAPTGADPKDRLPEFRRYETSQVALFEGRLVEAAAMLRKILVEDPHNTLARRDLGGIYLEEKQYARARVELEKVAAAAPDDYVTQYQLGLALEHLKLLDLAETHLRLACNLAPDAVPCQNELKAVREARKGK